MQDEHSVVRSLWLKIPLIVRSILLGFFVSTVGVFIWAISPIIFPGIWSIVFMAVILVLFIGFFSGLWVQSSFQQFRKESFGSIRLSPYKIKWGIVAAILLVLIVQSSLTLTFRWIEYPEAIFKAEYSYISQVPKGLAWISIIMASMVAGICEEIGYRGYLQRPLEGKYNATTAILITSIVFVVIHLHQAWAPPIIPLIFMISVFLGYLAHSFNSIIPGIIGHVTFDIFNFSFWWSDLLGKFTRKPISQSGIDVHFILTGIILIISVLGFIQINRMVRKREKVIQDL